MPKFEVQNYLQNILYMAAEELYNFSITAPHRYKKYDIAKRNGRGTRRIAHPARELKFIQRLLVDELVKVLPIHEKAMAYRKGLGIKDNALMHASNAYLLKMDFSDFFPSITPDLFFNCAERFDIVFSDIDKSLLANLLFYKLYRNSSLKLSIGAPSSPLISNFVMYIFDVEMDKFCLEKGISYSRYADDITFSTNEKEVLFDVPDNVKQILAVNYENSLSVNDDKTIFSSKKHNRHVTGVTLSNEGKLSLGRTRKRTISAMVHKALGNEELVDIDKLLGLLSFAKDIEPLFLKRLEAKYGVDFLQKVKLKRT